MKSNMIMRIFLCAVLVVGVMSRVEARSLSRQLSSLFGKDGLVLTGVPVGGVVHDAHFNTASLLELNQLIQQFAPNAADFPAVSTTPGFVFRFNPQSGAFERVSTSLGSVFVERPQTVGRGKFDIGISYLYINFTELNGDDLDDLQFTGLEHNDCCGQRPNLDPNSPNPDFERDTADLLFQKFDLKSHIVSFSATYGITNRWDVNVYLPVIFTQLKVRARAVINNESGVHFFDEGMTQTTQERSIDDDKIGVGDLLLRTKYHFLETKGVNLASGLVLRVPTGSKDNFQGLGDTTLTPFLAFAYEFRPFELHVSSGLEVNFDEWERSRVRYAGGVTLNVVEQFAIYADIIGSSSIEETRVSTTVPQFVNSPAGSIPPSQADPPVNIPDFRTSTTKIRTDIVDLSVGFKVSIQRSLVGFAGILLPLNDDGLRAKIIPSAGLNISF